MTSTAARLHEAVRRADLQLVENLIKSNVDINEVYYGMTPLLVAISHDNEEIAQKLIAKGCDVAKTDVQKTMVPFQEAVARHQVKVVQSIITSGKNKVNLDDKLNKSFHTPLTFACEKGYGTLVSALIQAGASTGLENGKQEYPLYVASREGWSDICRSLLKSGGPKDTPCGNPSQSPLIMAVLNEHQEIVKSLLEASCNVNQTDGNGSTPLWYAVTSGNQELTKLLIHYGADVHHKDKDGVTLVDIAKGDDLDDILEVLMKGSSAKK